jgi:hypothetical protein
MHPHFYLPLCPSPTRPSVLPPATSVDDGETVAGDDAVRVAEEDGAPVAGGLCRAPQAGWQKAGRRGSATSRHGRRCTGEWRTGSWRSRAPLLSLMLREGGWLRGGVFVAVRGPRPFVTVIILPSRGRHHGTCPRHAEIRCPPYSRTGYLCPLATLRERARMRGKPVKRLRRFSRDAAWA